MKMILSDIDYYFDEYDAKIDLVDNAVIPDECIELTIHANNFNHNINFHDNIKIITFTFPFNYPIQNIKFPSQLEQLIFFRGLKNQKLNQTNINENCIIKLNWSYDEIVINNLPNIKKLILCDILMPLTNLPASLEYLEYTLINKNTTENFNNSKFPFGCHINQKYKVYETGEILIV